MAYSNIRFKVPELELLQCQLVRAKHKLSREQWVAMMLTYLCAGGDYPGAFAEARVSELDPDVAHFQFRWDRSLILAVDPGLALAELDLSSLLSITWAWLHSPDLMVSASLACRLAAFASSFRGGLPYTWKDIEHPRDSTDPHRVLATHLQPDPSAFPWNKP